MQLLRYGTIAGCCFSAVLLLPALFARPQKTPSTGSTPVPVRYTDVRKEAGIAFQQDSTQTDEKYYLETMGTGVAWLDYDQDGLMDLFFVQSAATDIYKPPHPLRDRKSTRLNSSHV